MPKEALNLFEQSTIQVTVAGKNQLKLYRKTALQTGFRIKKLAEDGTISVYNDEEGSYSTVPLEPGHVQILIRKPENQVDHASFWRALTENKAALKQSKLHFLRGFNSKQI